MFRVYKTHVVFDKQHFHEVWIDPHYESKHGESINDDLIFKLLHTLEECLIETSLVKDQFRYYELNVLYQLKNYRLIIVRPLNDTYLGVRNAHRSSK